MTVGETLSQYATEAAPAVGTLALAAFAWLCARATAWVTAHTKNKMILAITDRATTEAKTAVAAADQIAVEDLKAKNGGTLSAADAEKIKADVLAQLRANLGGDAWVATAQKVLGVQDIEAYLSSKVEAAVHALGQASAPAVVLQASAPVAPAVATRGNFPPVASMPPSSPK
jgi:molybdopterin converting factor small subunit